MDAYLYQAAFLCTDCAQKVIIECVLERTGNRDDSDAYPQGPYSDGGGEADSPQHCDHCSLFLENPLTGDGYTYVAEQFDNYGTSNHGSNEVFREWAKFYKGDDDDLDRAIEEAGIL